jgi:hypothetical protein
MDLPTQISHYFEREEGPFLNICDLDSDQRSRIVSREKDAETGFNRFSYGDEFFDFRLLADDLILELYESKFGKRPARRPFYGVLGNADVVGGLYRDPWKIRMPIDEFASHELTFMCPDHFHLVSFMKRSGGKKMFGWQVPKDYCESEFPFFGNLLTYQELHEGLQKLKIDQHLETQRKKNGWYRYVEAQIWTNPEILKNKFADWIEVEPEPWTYNGTTYLQNYKTLNAEASNKRRR